MSKLTKEQVRAAVRQAMYDYETLRLHNLRLKDMAISRPETGTNVSYIRSGAKPGSCKK